MTSEIMMDSSSEIAHVFGKPGGDLNTTMSVSSDEEELDHFAAALEGGIIGAGDDLEGGIIGTEDETVAISNRSFEAVVKMYSDSLHALRNIRETDFQSQNICREGTDENDESSSDITIVFTENQPDTDNDDFGGDDAEDYLLSREFGVVEQWIKGKRTRKRKLTACLVALGVLVVLLLVIAIVILAISLGKETNSSPTALLGSGNGLLGEASGGYQGSTGDFVMETSVPISPADAPTIGSEFSLETSVPSSPADAPTIGSEFSMETSVPSSPLQECIPFVETVEDCFVDRIVVSFHRCGSVQDSFVGIWNEDAAKDPQRLPTPEAWAWTCTGENCDGRDASSLSGGLAFDIELPKGRYVAHMVKTEDQQKESASSIASSQTFDVDKRCG